MGYVALGYRDFRLHLGFRILSAFAAQVQNVGVGWFVYTETKSAWALGFVGLASFLPALCFAMFTGHVADNYNRRIIVGISFFACAIGAIGLALTAAFGGGETWPVYGCILLTGAGRAFGLPASNAITPLLVKREHFANAITWFATGQQIAVVSGPAIGGLLYAFGPVVVFCAAALAFIGSSLCSLSIRVPMGRDGRPREKVSFKTLAAGLKFIWSRPELFGSISLDLAAVLFGGATALMPIIAQDVLHTGPFGLGLLRSAPAIGALVTSAALTRFPLESRVGLKMLIAVGVFGVAIVGFGLSTWLPLSMGFLMVMGGANSVSVVVRHTMIQIETPDEMRGRVAAVNSIFTGTSNDLGDFESGVTAALFGAVPAVVLGGVLTMMTAALWGWMFPAIRLRDKLLRD